MTQVVDDLFIAQNIEFITSLAELVSRCVATKKLIIIITMMLGGCERHNKLMVLFSLIENIHPQNSLHCNRGKLA